MSRSPACAPKLKHAGQRWPALVQADDLFWGRQGECSPFCTAGQQCADLIARLPAADILANGNHLAGHFQAQNRRRARRRRIAAFALHNIRPIHPGGAHAHAQLAGAGHWPRGFAPIQSVRPTGSVLQHGVHLGVHGIARQKNDNARCYPHPLAHAKRRLRHGLCVGNGKNLVRSAQQHTPQRRPVSKSRAPGHRRRSCPNASPHSTIILSHAPNTRPSTASPSNKQSTSTNPSIPRSQVSWRLASWRVAAMPWSISCWRSMSPSR